MKLSTAISTFVGCTLLGAGIGGGIGYALGRLAPGYYRSVFVDGNEPWFDPVAVGIGQGVTQGAGGGIVVGMAFVVLFVWRDIRMAAPVDRLQEGAPRPRKIPMGLMIFAAIVGVLGLGSACVVVDVFVRPEVWVHPQRRLSRDGTKQRIQRLNDALDKYALDHDGHYPSIRQGLEALYVKPQDDVAWHGPYGQGQDGKLRDAWDQPLRYAEPSAESGSRKPTVWSVGPDKAPETSDDIR